MRKVGIVLIAALLLASVLAVQPQRVSAAKEVKGEGEYITPGRYLLKGSEDKDYIFRLAVEPGEVYAISVYAYAGEVNAFVKQVLEYSDKYIYPEDEPLYISTIVSLYADQWGTPEYDYAVFSVPLKQKYGYYLIEVNTHPFYGWYSILLTIDKLGEEEGQLTGNKTIDFSTLTDEAKIWDLEMASGVYTVTISQKLLGVVAPITQLAFIEITASYSLEADTFLKVYLNGVGIGGFSVPSGSDTTTFVLEVPYNVSSALKYVSKVGIEAELSGSDYITISSVRIRAYTTLGEMSASNSTVSVLNSTVDEVEYLVSLTTPSHGIAYTIFNEELPNPLAQFTLWGNTSKTFTLYLSEEYPVKLLAYANFYGVAEVNVTFVKHRMVLVNEGREFSVLISEAESEAYLALKLQDGVWKLNFDLKEGDNWTVTLSYLDGIVLSDIGSITVSAGTTWRTYDAYYAVFYRGARVSEYVNSSLSVDLFAFSNATKTLQHWALRKYMQGAADYLLLRVKGSPLTNNTLSIGLSLTPVKLSDIKEPDLSNPYTFEQDGNLEPAIEVLKFKVPPALLKVRAEVDRGTPKVSIIAKEGGFSDVTDWMSWLFGSSSFSSTLFAILSSGGLAENVTYYLPVAGTPELVLILWCGYNSSLKVTIEKVKPAKLEDYKVTEPFTFAEFEVEDVWSKLEAEGGRAYIMFLDEEGRLAAKPYFAEASPNYLPTSAIRFYRTGKVYAIVAFESYYDSITIRLVPLEVTGNTFWSSFLTLMAYATPAGIVAGVAVYLLILRKRLSPE